MAELQLSIESQDGITSKVFDARALVIAGWTGRDKEAMEHHIEELVALGVSRPETTPTYYRLAASRLCITNQIEASGSQSSGEAEFVLAAIDGELYVGLGSDHTDREVEAYGVTVSKQMCDKPVSSTFWPYEEVKDHWDSLTLRSYVTINSKRQLYQEGQVDSMLDPEELIYGYTNGASLSAGTVVFGGTVPAIGGIRPADHFEAEIEDPILERRIALSYGLTILPVNG